MNPRLTSPIPMVLFTAIPTLIGQFGMLLQRVDYKSEKSSQPPMAAYDYVVVGGGSAGCVVAARLSENPQVSVLLLEAGGNPSPLSFIPLATPFLQNNPTTDWQYSTTPINSSDILLGNRPLVWPRGKGLGGSSTTNYMIYMRGNPQDFDQWANITEDPRWSYANVEKYFNKMEDYHGRYERDGNYHGKNGPLSIEPLKYAPGLENVLDAVKEAGFSVRDLNKHQQEGFSPIDFTQKRGRRHSAYSAYLEPILRRRNLKILRYSHVTKIHLDSKRKATGVSYVRKGSPSYVSAKKEVIVCGGTIGSAQLLLLSGIGPSKHLKSVGVKPLVELPVGRNLADHVITLVGPIILKQNGSVPVSSMPADVTFSSFNDFAINGDGPFTSAMGLMVAGVTSSSTSPGWPNLLYFILSLGIYDGLGAAIDQVYGSGNYTKELLHPFIGQDAHFTVLSAGKPKSRGYIELLDNNPFSKPIINPQYYSDSGNQDLQDMIEGYETIVNLYENTNALGYKLGARLAKIPNCAGYELRTRGYYECAIKTAIRTVFHPVGTCSMGKIGDPKAVVDSKLRVIGTKGLRVIDASVMPEVTNANTNAPTIMIGELGADLIKENFH
ncbi:Glucose dehydrogenase [FAD, quinone] [Orchesella cincta]|uniref:Glucose dehydrogenase [FAD, quinone] n=1 Tax=Orchesella cincta TaxID=48709 RepID=A0A1D2M349_ORCCI|nr:Glucose dehydrogenase [FAD, quinone] [Orchesella cincta]